MKTAVVWIGARAADHAYPARLFFEPPHGREWHSGEPEARRAASHRRTPNRKDSPLAAKPPVSVAEARRMLAGNAPEGWKQAGEFLQGLLAAEDWLASSTTYASSSPTTCA